MTLCRLPTVSIIQWETRHGLAAGLSTVYAGATPLQNSQTYSKLARMGTSRVLNSSRRWKRERRGYSTRIYLHLHVRGYRKRPAKHSRQVSTSHPLSLSKCCQDVQGKHFDIYYIEIVFFFVFTLYSNKRYYV